MAWFTLEWTFQTAPTRCDVHQFSSYASTCFREKQPPTNATTGRKTHKPHALTTTGSYHQRHTNVACKNRGNVAISLVCLFTPPVNFGLQHQDAISAVSGLSGRPLSADHHASQTQQDSFSEPHPG
ncbi:hypothetical protein ZHAS_00015065 [Anopheles sinensis]|uniref:Uncharacterized protein n=1 Tax=Anopheles sinensis TaxID=74873 RepID=A0A084WA02_ANOSI|nr:hypothetical protein ZHAS_00015065 [Anopheles sinensis]